MDFQSLFVLILIFYLVATLFYLLRLVVGRAVLGGVGLRVTLAAALLQAGVLAAHFATSPGPFFRSYTDYFQISALLLAGLFIALCFAKKFYAAGPLFLTLIDVLCSLSLTYESPYHYAAPSRGTGYLAIHLGAIFLSLSVFAVGLVSAILFLVAERQIKLKRLEGWAAKLPPLAELDAVHYKALYAGFILFTLAIVTGAGYSKIRTGHYVAEDFKQILSFALWFFFAVLLNFRVRKGLQGHKGVVLSLAGFAGMILLFFVGF